MLQPPVRRRGALGIMVVAATVCLVAATVCLSVIPPRLMALATSTFTLSCDASSASPNPVAPGGTATLQASATSSQTYTDANILFDVFDSTGTRVYYISRHNVNFTGGVVQTFMGTWSVPSTQAAGPYMLKFGVFTATWSTLYAYKTCTTFSVAAGATGTSANTPAATATLAPAATIPATTSTPASSTTTSPGGATFSNSFDDQSTGALVTGSGANQFNGTSGFTSLRVQNTAISSPPNALGVTVDGGGSAYVYKQYSSAYTQYDLTFNLQLGADFTLPSTEYMNLAQTVPSTTSNVGKVTVVLPADNRIGLDYFDSAGQQHYLWGSYALPTGSWHTVEVRETMGAGSGSLALLVDGNTVASGSNLDLGAQGLTWFAVGERYSPLDSGISGHLYIDDVTAVDPAAPAAAGTPAPTGAPAVSTAPPTATATLAPAATTPVATATLAPAADTPVATATLAPAATTPATTSPTASSTMASPSGATSTPPSATATLVPVSGPVFYVSKNGNNADGTSWATAWNELNQINWSVVPAGATILLDGGTTAMTYTTVLAPKSGTASAPITIRLAADSGHNGQAIFFGGRSTPLPYCGQTGYIWQTAGVNQFSVDLRGQSYVILDGTKWRGIDIHGNNLNGIIMDGNSNHMTVKYLDIYDNGTVTSSAGSTDEPNVRVGGSDNWFDHDIIHDGGQDDFQSGVTNTNLRVSYSWLYFGRQNPLDPIGISANEECTHNDGMQIYAGGTQGPITFDHVIIGPGAMNGAILGEQNAAQVNDVTFSNVVCLDAEENCFIDNPGGNAQRWHWDHVTTILTPLNPIGTGASAFYMDGAGDSVTNSIIAGSNVRLPGDTTGAGNCQYNTQGSGAPLIGGEGIDPQLGAVQSSPNNATLDAWSNATFAPGPGSPCAGKGADLTSVAQLLSQ